MVDQPDQSGTDSGGLPPVVHPRVMLRVEPAARMEQPPLDAAMDLGRPTPVAEHTADGDILALVHVRRQQVATVVLRQFAGTLLLALALRHVAFPMCSRTSGGCKPVGQPEKNIVFYRSKRRSAKRLNHQPLRIAEFSRSAHPAVGRKRFDEAPADPAFAEQGGLAESAVKTFHMVSYMASETIHQNGKFIAAARSRTVQKVGSVDDTPQFCSLGRREHLLPRAWVVVTATSVWKQVKLPSTTAYCRQFTTVLAV